MSGGYKRFEDEEDGGAINYKDLLGRELLDAISHSVIDTMNADILMQIGMIEPNSYNKEAEKEIVESVTNRAFELLSEEVLDILGFDLKEMDEIIRVEARDMMREAIYKIIDENNKIAKELRHKDKIIDMLEGNIQKNPEAEEGIRGLIAKFQEIPDDLLELKNFNEAMQFGSTEKGKDLFQRKLASLKAEEMTKPEESRKSDVDMDNEASNFVGTVKDVMSVCMHEKGSISKFLQDRQAEKEARSEHLIDVNNHRQKVVKSRETLLAERSFMQKLGDFFGHMAKNIERFFSSKSRDEKLKVDRLRILKNTIAQKKHDNLDRFRRSTAVEAMQAAAMFALKDKMRTEAHDIDSIRNAVLHPRHLNTIVKHLGGVDKVRKKATR